MEQPACHALRFRTQVPSDRVRPGTKLRMRTSWCRALLLVIIGCSGRGQEAGEPPPPSVTPPRPAPPMAASTSRSEWGGGIRWDVTAPFIRREPKSPMRAAEYGVDGEPSVELAVFHYGDDKISIEGQIRAWLVQFEQRDGSDTAQKAKRKELKVGPLLVNTVEVSGIYTGPVAMPGVQVTPERDSILLGAIVTGPKGPVIFKLSGPHDGVEPARPAFEQLVHSVRPE